MLYLGGVTLGYFHLYPPGFQPKGKTDGDDAPAVSVVEAEGSSAAAEKPPAPHKKSSMTFHSQPAG